MDLNFDDIYKTYYSRVYYTALRILKEPGLAEDILQDTFMKAYDKLDEIGDPSKIGAWLTTIASRKAIDFLRRRKRIVFLPIEESHLTYAAHASLDSNVEKVLEAIVLQERIKRMVHTLTPKLQAVFLLHYEQELKESEIASRLHISKAAVKSRLHRARLAIKDRMREKPEFYYSA
ncbi:RNA polymerase sigma factor [Halobacillus campisalis]|uniref:RNA polymerase sigma factor n=1 Tax=Halobacillus campisalis TaxID=435909 RepID=A0ABW2K0N2_9BACI|nr:RNA polymerase sigma factor [Halobacillus campisalis]